MFPFFKDSFTNKTKRKVTLLSKERFTETSVIITEKKGLELTKLTFSLNTLICYD
jgi:hypothetical protein